MKTLLFLLILLPKLSIAQDVPVVIPHSTSTPQTAVIKPLQIGDAIPDVVLNNIINYKTTGTRLSHFKGKLIILDFFATWCGACIKELPKLDSLQKQFAGSVQVLVISYQPGTTINQFLSSNKIAKKVSLAFMPGDSILSALFPHRMLPHQVWINQQGIVSAITYPQYTTGQNIELALKDAMPRLPIKKDVLDFDKHKPLLYNNNGGTEESLLYRSVFTKYLEGVNSLTGTATVNGTKRLYYVNFSVLGLYGIATGFRNSNRVILQVKDTGAYIHTGPIDGQWRSANYYSYELYVPAAATRQQTGKLMLSDLNRYLGINGRIETARVKCWALVKTPSKTQATPPPAAAGEEKTTAEVINQPLSALLYQLNMQLPARPLQPVIVDETGYTGMVSIRLSSRLSDIASLKKELNPYGFDLIAVERDIDMLILTEQD